VPAIKTISSAWILINPCETRHTPSARAAAAPIATPQSVIPRVITPIDKTRSELSQSSRALAASRRP
jgi:precorrin-2 methylase